MTQIGILQLQSLQHVLGLIRGSHVDDDDFEAGVVLIQDDRQMASQGRCLVMGCDDDGQRWQVLFDSIQLFVNFLEAASQLTILVGRDDGQYPDE